MNMLAALTLSPSHQAYSWINTQVGLLLYRPAYALKVTEIEQGDQKQYRLEVFQVFYPDKAEGKGWGDPKIAEKPHFSQVFALDDLVSFADQREFNLDNGWCSVEGNNDLTA